MNEIIQKINDLTTQTKALPSISEKNKQQLDKKFRLEFNYNSNHIEGNTLTLGETQYLLYFDKTEGTHEMREYEEMKAHDVAYKLIQAQAQDTERPLSEKDIKDLNGIILVRDFYKDALTPDGQPTRRKLKVGQYKEFPNSVGLQNGEMFEYATPQDTPIKMAELMQFYHAETEKNELHVVELAAFIHYKFVRIHPFDDGNGRISRLLMNYILLKNGLPPIIIKSEDKKNYLNALNQADTGNLQAFVNYIAKQLVWSLELVLKATKGEDVNETNDIYKEIEMFKREQLSTASTEKGNIKSIETVKKCFLENVEPFLSQYEDAIKTSFSGLFNEIRTITLISGSTYRGENKDVFSEVKNDLANIINANILDEIKLVKILDNPVNTQLPQARFDVFITFEMFSFTMKYQDNTLILSKKYNTKLEDFEITQAVNQCMKLAFEEIKKNTIK